MASLRQHPRSPFWFAWFTLPDGRRTQRSTGVPVAGVHPSDLDPLKRALRETLGAEIAIPESAARGNEGLNTREARRLAQRIAAEFEQAGREARAKRLTEHRARSAIADLFALSNDETLPAGDNPEAPLFPDAHAARQRSQYGGTLSSQFHGILVAAGLAKARPHTSMGKGRDSRRNLGGMSFHCLRHTSTSLLKNAGVSDAVARDIIGHDSPAVSASYPTGSDSAPGAVASGTGAGAAVYDQPGAQGPADIENAGGLSPYGTMGQGGNAFEWVESASDGEYDSGSKFRALRGFSWNYDVAALMGVLGRVGDAVSDETITYGFRVAAVPAAVPEPMETAGALGVAALGFALWRRRGSRWPLSLLPFVRCA
jgi:hypothetical protein